MLKVYNASMNVDGSCCCIAQWCLCGACVYHSAPCHHCLTTHPSVDGPFSLVPFFTVSSAVGGHPFLLMVIDVLLTANVLQFLCPFFSYGFRTRLECWLLLLLTCHWICWLKWVACPLVIRTMELRGVQASAYRRGLLDYGEFKCEHFTHFNNFRGKYVSKPLQGSMLLTVPVESRELRALAGFEEAWTHFNALTLSAQ